MSRSDTDKIMTTTWKEVKSLTKKNDGKMLQVRISMEMWNQLLEIAEYHDRNASSLIRILIRNAWKRHQRREEEDI